jgi:hypothetical protein
MADPKEQPAPPPPKPTPPPPGIPATDPPGSNLDWTIYRQPGKK